jgi:hypothetical protein
MTRLEEKHYLQHVFEAIDKVYQMKKQTSTCNYEERLRASYNKLLVPDWYNHEYTSTNGLRKTKSHGHVPRIKRVNGTNHNDNNNNNNNNNNNHYNHQQQHDDTPDVSVSLSLHSPNLSNGSRQTSYRHRSPSRSWSERAPMRHDSTSSSYDTNGSVINGRRSAMSNGTSSYAPGMQRVAQSSTWYKPRIFPMKITNDICNHITSSIQMPKPLPRQSKIGKRSTVV